jgi:protein ImuB
MQFSPSVGIEPLPPPGSLLLDITGVAHLFGGEARLGETILRELAAAGHSVQAAVADTIGAAWAVTQFGTKEKGERIKDEEIRKEEGGRRKEDCKLQNQTTGFPLGAHPSSSFILHPSSLFLVPPGETRAALRPLPIEALRLPEPTVALLHQLGIRRIEQLEALPRRELLSRFGPQLLAAWDRATGRLDEPLPLYRPPPRFVAGWSPEQPTARRETIEAAIERLSGRLCEMLRRDGRGAVQLECRLECTAGDPLEVSVGLFHPTAWARHLVELLRVRLERLRLPGAVRRVRLAAAATAPLELRQQELFSEQSSRRQPRRLAGLVNRLSNRLGRLCVVRPRLVADAQPEMACRYVPLVKCRLPLARKGVRNLLCEAPAGPFRQKVPDPFSQPQAARPVRLLTPPIQLTAGLGGRFDFAGRSYQLAHAWGPERIETGWWRGQAVGRDYYRVETTCGRRFWMFRNLEDNRWFLHGVFE